MTDTGWSHALRRLLSTGAIDPVPNSHSQSQGVMMPINLDEAIELIRTEYAEMPGLSMTGRQVRRVWSLSNDVCQEALTALTQAGFLVENRHSSYVRARICRPDGSAN